MVFLLQLLSISIWMLISTVKCHRVLVVSSIAGGSHHRFMHQLSIVLADKGHEVTFVRNNINSDSIKPSRKFETLVLDDAQGAETYRKMTVMQKWNASNSIHIAGALKNLVECSAEHSIDNHDFWMQLAQRDPPYDILFINEFMTWVTLGQLVHEVFRGRLPWVYVDATTLWILNTEPHAIPSPLSTVRQMNMLELPDVSPDMNFQDRLINAVNYIGSKYVFYGIFERTANRLLKEKLNPNMPPIQEIIASASLVMVNSDWAIQDARPITPNVVFIGGMNCVPPKPLPNDLEKFVSDPADGLVLVSFGTNLTPDMLGPPVVKAILDALKIVIGKKKRSVIWKLNDGVSWMRKHIDDKIHIPPNIRIMDWVPQQDVLGHNNTKAFLGHGGLNGVFEAIYHAVPSVMLPGFGDQQTNAQMIAERGLAIALDKNKLTAAGIAAAVEAVATEPSYTESARHWSGVLRDHPLTPAERIHFWTNYVVRHKGAPHLRSAVAARLSLVEYFMLDVAALLLACLSMVVLLVYKLLRWCWCCCCARAANCPAAEATGADSKKRR